jgi:hypothetical protein
MFFVCVPRFPTCIIVSTLSSHRFKFDIASSLTVGNKNTKNFLQYLTNVRTRHLANMDDGIPQSHTLLKKTRNTSIQHVDTVHGECCMVHGAWCMVHGQTAWN